MNTNQTAIHKLNKNMEDSPATALPTWVTQMNSLDLELGETLTEFMANYSNTPATEKEALVLEAKRAIDERFFVLGVPQNHYELPTLGCEPKPFANLWVLRMIQHLN